MAGVLFLKNRNVNSSIAFKNKCHKIKSYVENHFSQFFRKVIFINPDQNTFLVFFQKNDNYKYYSNNSGSWLAYEGIVFALKKTKILNAKDIFNLYHKYQEDFIKHLDGHFVIKLYDKSKDKTLICNDFIKNRTNYILETAHEIMVTPFLLFTSFIKKPELDMTAFNEYMWRYYIMSDRTMLTDVRRLTGAELIEISGNNITKRKYWNFPKQYTDMSFNDSVDALCNSLKETARLIESDGRKPLIEFTMGQDSRTVLSSFTNQNFPFTTAIYGKDSFHEVQNVKEMSERHNFQNHHIQLQDSFINTPWENTKDSILLGNAEEPVYIMGRILHMRMQYLTISTLALNGVHGRFYKDGIWNEMILMNLYREPKKFNSDVFIKYRALNKNYRDDIFNTNYKILKDNSSKYFNQLIQSSISGYEDSPMPMQVDKFDVEHYAVFGMTANNICNNIIDLVSPLLLRRNLEFAFTLPAKWRYNLSRIQRAIVYKLDPNLAREKTDFAGLNMVPTNPITFLPFMFRYWFGQSKKFRDKLKNLMGFNVKTQLQKAWDYKTIYQNFLKDDEVQSLLNYDTLKLSTIIDKKPWQKLVEQYNNDEFHSLERLEYILKIVTVEYFLKKCSEIENIN